MITVTTNTITMTSQEIATLVEARHDSVKRTVERLAEAGVITLPPLVETSFLNSIGRTQHSQVYVFSGDQGKRDTTVIVAQLSPQFTGQLVDRWIELEKQVQQPTPSYMIEDSLERAKRWIEETTAQREIQAQLNTKLLETQKVVELQTPKVEVYDVIANKDTTYTIRDTAKLLKVRPIDLTTWLLENDWMYGNKSSTYRPKASHADTHILLVVNSYGTQVRVTSKGLVLLAKKMNKTIDNT